MAEFGIYPRYESRVYTVPVEARTVPLSLHVPFRGSGPRDFVFIPDGRTAQLLPAAFERFAHSDALRSVFCYMGEGAAELALGDSVAFPSARRRELRFALVKWNRSTAQPFPTAVHCVQKVPYGYGERAMHEIVEATSVAVSAAREVLK